MISGVSFLADGSWWFVHAFFSPRTLGELEAVRRLSKQLQEAKVHQAWTLGEGCVDYNRFWYEKGDIIYYKLLLLNTIEYTDALLQN